MTIQHEPQTNHVSGETLDASSAVLHRSLRAQPLKVVSANGLYLHLENGQCVLDATAGAAVACLGHNNAKVKAALARQMDAVSYCHSLFYSTEAMEQLCRMLADGTQGKMPKAFIVSSGSEAMESAVKMARQYFTELEGKSTKRTRFIARRQSYHGTTLGALAISGHLARRELFEPLLSNQVSHVSPCNAYRGLQAGESTADYVQRLAQELDDEFQRVGPDTVCAFVAEPVVGAALGCVPAVPGYFHAVRQVCDKYGALLILDEIMSGVGRSGYMHVWQSPLVDVQPDLQTIGKGLGGGYVPVAAMLMSHKVIDVLGRGTGAFVHGQTYQGHPIACATALAVQQELRNEKLVERARHLGVILENELKNGLSDHDHVGDVRGMGLFWGIEFVKDKTTKEAFDPKLQVASRIHDLGIKEPFSISIYPGGGTADGWQGDHVLLAPPFTCTDTEIRTVASKTVEVIKTFFHDFARSS